MELAVDSHPLVIHQLKRVTSISIHVLVSIRNTAITKQEAHLMSGLRTQSDEVPEHVRILQQVKTISLRCLYFVCLVWSISLTDQAQKKTIIISTRYYTVNLHCTLQYTFPEKVMWILKGWFRDIKFSRIWRVFDIKLMLVKHIFSSVTTVKALFNGCLIRPLYTL